MSSSYRCTQFVRLFLRNWLHLNVLAPEGKIEKNETVSEAAMRETIEKFETLEAKDEEKITQLTKQAEKHEKAVYDLIKHKGAGAVKTLSRSDQNKVIFLLQQSSQARTEIEKIQRQKTMVAGLRSKFTMATFYQTSSTTLDLALKQASAAGLTDAEKIIKKQRQNQLAVDKISTAIDIQDDFNESQASEAKSELKEVDLTTFADEIERLEMKANEEILKECDERWYNGANSSYREQSQEITEPEDTDTEELELQRAMAAKIRKGI